MIDILLCNMIAHVGYNITLVKKTVAFLPLALLLIFGNAAISQDFDSEKDLEKQAEKYFSAENYTDAFPLYSQLLSLYPSNTDHDYRFSVCMLYTDKDREKGLERLKLVAKKPDADAMTFYHLAHAYQLTYRFVNAIDAYNKFKSTAGSKNKKELLVDRNIEMCKNGLELLKNVTDLSVIDKKETKESEYFRSYDAETFNGKLLVKPDDFKSESDKNNQEASVIFLPKEAEILYFSSYGKEGDNKDIYKVKKSTGGGWGPPEKLSGLINTQYDEDFPFMHPNGNVMYFSSKGHNSMGGYDIFKSTLETSSNTWGKPVNMDFAINSPDDDILFITDEDEKLAMFSSKRESEKGMITVYKVGLKRKPAAPELIAVKETDKKAVDEKTGEVDIEYVKDEAALNVNSSEDEFLAAYQSIKPPVKTEITKEEAPETNVEEIAFSQFKDDELVSTASEFANSIDQKAQEQKKQSETARFLAADKQQESEEKELKAQETTLTVTEKEQLLEESAKLKSEAVIASEMASILEESAVANEQKAIVAKNNAVQIEKLIKENKKEESVAMLIDQKILMETSIEEPSVAETKAGEAIQKADIKQAEANEAMEKVQFLESEKTETQKNIKMLSDEAGKTKDKEIKKELLSQADELSKELELSDKNIAEAYQEAKTLESEAKELKKESQIVSSISGEIDENYVAVKKPTSSGKKKTDTKLPDKSEPDVDKEEPLVSIVPKEEKTGDSAASQNIEEIESNMQTGEKSYNDYKNELDDISAGEVMDNEISADVETMKNESESLFEESKNAKQNAIAQPDPEKKRAELKKADALQILAVTKQEEAINTYRYETEKKELSEIKSAVGATESSEFDSARELENESAQLFQTAQSLKTDAASINDPVEKSAALQEAVATESKAVEKQQSAINTYRYQSNKQELNTISKTAPANQLKEITESEDLYKQANMSREKAAAAENPAEKKSEEQRAVAYEKLAVEKQNEAINTYNYNTNKINLDALKTSTVVKDPNKIAAAKQLETEADGLFMQAKTIRESTSLISDPKIKANEFIKADETEKIAIISQQKAIEEYGAGVEKPAAITTPEITSSEKESGEPVVSSAAAKNVDQEVQKIKSEATTPVQLQQAVNDKRSESAALKAKASEQRNESQTLLENADGITDMSALEEVLMQAEALEEEALQNETKAQTIEQAANKIEAEIPDALALSTQPARESPVSEETIDKKPEMIQDVDADIAQEKKPEPEVETKIQTETEPQPITTSEPVPVLNKKETIAAITQGKYVQPLPFDVFRLAKVVSDIPLPTYNKSNPIPINTTLPTGIIFKVQVGAFRNPIPQNLFKDISPLMGEKTAMGFIRYTAGLFKTFQSADNAKNTIRGLGFSDAFVVAFYNGNRISVNEAKAILRGERPESALAVTTPAQIENVKKTMITASTPGTTEIEKIQGLLYTVQVGAFSKQVSSKKVYKLSPVYTFASGGLTKYNYGIFNNLQEAFAAKNKAIDNGIKDAFVTAYYNGKRITIPQAKALEASGQSDLFAKTPEQPVSSIPAEKAPPLKSPEKDPLAGAKIIYKVQVGEFKDEVPIARASLFLKISGMGIEKNPGENGFTVYTVGAFDNYNSAEGLKTKVIAQGISDAVVVTYADGKKIDTQKKKQLSGDAVSPESESDTYDAVSPETALPVMAVDEANALQEELRAALTVVSEFDDAARKNYQDAIDTCSAITRESYIKDSVGVEQKISAIAALMKTAIGKHEEAKVAYDKAKDIESTVRSKMLEGGISGEEVTKRLEATNAGAHDKDMFKAVSESEAQQIIDGLNSEYAQLEAAQNTARVKMKEASAMLYGSRIANEETIRLVKQSLDMVRDVKNKYDDAGYRIYKSRCDLLMATYSEEYVRTKVVPGSEFDQSIVKPIAEEEINTLVKEIQHAHNDVMSIEAGVREMINDAEGACFELDPEMTKQAKENTIKKVADLITRAKQDHIRAKDSLNLAKALEVTAGYKMQLGGRNQTDINTYLAAIEPGIYKENMFSPMSDAQKSAVKADVESMYRKAETLQNSTKLKIEEARKLLYSVDIITDGLKAMVDAALNGFELAKYAYQDAEYNLYSSRCKMLLATITKDETDLYLVALSEFDEGIIKKMSEEEKQELIEKTRATFNKVYKIESAAQSKIDQGNNIIEASEKIDYPDEKQREAIKGKELRTAGINEMEIVEKERGGARNIFEIGLYKMYISGMTDDDPDVQRLIVIAD